MGFKPSNHQPDFSKLLGFLNDSKLIQTNPALFQTIQEIIRRIQQADNIFKDELADILDALKASFLTATPESGRLPNSRELVAGLGITFDDTQPHKRIINADASGGYWTPLTDGNVDETDLIFADGEAIAVNVPIP